jgi:hypothetical protein
MSHDKAMKEGHTFTLAEQEALVGEVAKRQTDPFFPRRLPVRVHFKNKAGEVRSCRVSRSEGEGEEWVRGLGGC